MALRASRKPKESVESTDQLARFKEAARALECDDDPKAFKRLISKIAKAKPPKEASKQ